MQGGRREPCVRIPCVSEWRMSLQVESPPHPEPLVYLGRWADKTYSKENALEMDCKTRNERNGLRRKSEKEKFFMTWKERNRKNELRNGRQESGLEMQM